MRLGKRNIKLPLRVADIAIPLTSLVYSKKQEYDMKVLNNLLHLFTVKMKAIYSCSAACSCKLFVKAVQQILSNFGVHQVSWTILQNLFKIINSRSQVANIQHLLFCLRDTWSSQII